MKLSGRLNVLFLILILSFSNCPLLSSQTSNNQILFKNISRNEGLPRANVFSVAQDSRGYIWIAAPNGLNRFDGLEFKVYKFGTNSETDQMLNDQKIYSDKSGDIFTLVGGMPMTKYNKKLDSFIPIRNINSAKCIFQNSLGHYYIGTTGNGLYKIDFNTKDTTQLIIGENFPKQINRITEYKNNIYAASWDNIFKVDEKNNLERLIKPKGVDSLFNAISSSKLHGLWLGTFQKGLYKFNESTEEFDLFKGFKGHDIPTNLYITDLNFDSKNRLWICTYGNGLYVVDFKKENIIKLSNKKFNDNSLISDELSMTYEDSNKTMWIATEKGISLYDPYLYKFGKLTEFELAYENTLSKITEIDGDKYGNIWFSTASNGIFKLNSESGNIINYNSTNSPLSSNTIYSLQIFGDKLYTTSIPSSIQKFNFARDNDDLKLQYSNELNHPFLYGIHIDSKGGKRILVANLGLIEYNEDNNFRVLKSKVSKIDTKLSGKNIYYIIEDNESKIWITTDDGVYVINSDVPDVKKLNIPINNFSKICPDVDDTIWIWNHPKCLIHYNYKSNRTIKKFDYPPKFSVGSINLIDDWLWMGTTQGIVQINKHTGQLIQHNSDQSLQSLEFTSASYYDKNQGILYLGGKEGINWFQPEHVSLNPYAPKTIIKSIQLFDRNDDVSDLDTFNYNENTLTFNALALHYSLPQNNSFKYRLLNYDDEWISNNNNPTIRYSNLPSGDYEFQVKSSNYDNVWNETPAVYRFTIEPAWYLSNLALLFYSLFSICTIYLIYRYFKSRWALQTRLQLEHQESIRLKELNFLKNRLYTNISHEFRTPLTLITGPVERQLKKKKLKPNLKKDLNLVQRSAKRLLNLVDQLLDLAKLETGNLKLAVSLMEIKPLIIQITDSFKMLAKEKSIRFSSEMENLGKGWIDMDVVEKILGNLLSNAIKYTPHNGTIILTVKVKDEHLIISLINNGVKFSHNELPKLFERYYQNDRSNTGAGIGLSLVKELCVVSHGSVIVNLLAESEIQFTVNLPISRGAFSESEISETDRNNIKHSNGTEAMAISEELGMSKTKSSKPIMLIVEDDKDIRTFIKSIFQNDYVIKLAEDGVIGMGLALKYIPDVIISDIMMPKMDGIEMTDFLKENELTSHIPVLLLTAKSGNSNEITGLQSGADDYITKPFHIEAVRLKVKNLIKLRKNLQKKYSSGFKLDEIPYSNLDEQFLKRLQNILNEHITDPELSTEKLSKYMTMSRTQLHRKLKALSGVSTSELIRKQRTNLAKILLEDSSETISEIAYKVGFNSPSYFISCFKKDYKKAPSSFRNR